MKRSWIGFGLLLGILVISLLATAFMTRVHEEAALELKQSSECALLGDWENVRLFLTRAQNCWTKQVRIRSCLMDHTPAEELDAAFASLEIYRQARDPIAYRAACAALVSRMEALAEAQTITWWNLF
jgi:hypothetical protein